MILKWIVVIWAVGLARSEAYMPPTVQNQGYRRDGQQQFAYSYGTTAYHYNQQGQPVSGYSQQGQPLSGYASAQVTDQRSGGQGPTMAPECQNPMLRVFFKTCHPPGAAPQSPVQCQPIPGQTTFRCFIKQQSWPIVRITQCPPGSASASGGECVRLPSPGFGTTGIAIVPVMTGMPGQNRIIQASSSSVYRHCANGACQTCIGDQCSTTGIQTPVSVDQRGQANSTTEVVAFGDAGRDVKQKCSRNICKTCIDRICYDRSYPLLRVTAGCPSAVCDCNDGEFVYWTDQCPICRCSGFASREPCRTQSECPAGSTCRNQVCIYAALPNTHFDKVCTFSSQCTGDQLCYNWRCGAKPAQLRHLEDHSCAVDQDCPGGHTCADMTCWVGQAAQLNGQACTLDHQCPTGYFCTTGNCSSHYHHGSFDSFAPSAPTIPPTTDRQCAYDGHCYGGETCFENRCVSPAERRQIDEARRRQQTEHQGWRPRQEEYPTPTTATPPEAREQQGRVSADDEYQRRLAEYNRQRAEQERQYEERRRQLEEERRRQEETEAQRRRQGQDDGSRRREQEEQQRRQQEEENQRRLREQEEAQRRATEAENQNRQLQAQQAREQERRRQEQEEARRTQASEAETRQRQEQEASRRRAQEEEARRRQEQQQEEARRTREREEETRRRQEQETRRRQEEEETRRRQEQEEARRSQQEGEARRRQEEEARRRQEQEQEARRRQEPEQPGQLHPAPTPDTEVGEETEDGPHEEDDQEYERRTQEYNRQLRERERQLQAESEDEAEHDHADPSTTESIMGHVEVHDGEDDFYGRTRHRGRMAHNEHGDQSVAAYRVRYQRVRRRQ